MQRFPDFLQFLFASGVITIDTAEAVLGYTKTHSVGVPTALVESGVFKAEDLQKALEHH